MYAAPTLRYIVESAGARGLSWIARWKCGMATSGRPMKMFVRPIQLCVKGKLSLSPSWTSKMVPNTGSFLW